MTFDRSVIATRVSPSSFTLAPAGHAGDEGVIVYHVGTLWSADGVNTLQSISAGAALFVGFDLAYSGTTLGYLDADGSAPVNEQTIYYI